MGLLDTLNHLLNFIAPAFALAVLVPPLARFFVNRKVARPAFMMHSAVLFVACMAVLLAGLWVFGHDGKMATYLAMVLVCASAQWLMQRGWKA